MYLVFDCETTGKASFSLPPEHPSQPRLVQLGAQLLDSDFIVRAEINMIVRPDGYTIPDEVAAIHGITQAIAERDGLAEPFVLSCFAALCHKAAVLVAHNLQFDGIVMGRAFAAFPGECRLPATKRCTMREMTPVCRLPGGRGGDYKWPSLQEAHKHCTGYEFVGAHDAMADVRACATVLQWLETQKRDGAPSLVAPRTPNATANQNPVKAVPAEAYTDDTPMPFGKWKGTPLGRVPPSWFRWYLEQDNPSDLLLQDYAKARH